MKELEQIISRLKSQGIKAEKVSYPKQMVEEKRWIQHSKRHVTKGYRDLNGYSFT
ncbi:MULTISPECIES: hypothetical protein [Bacillus]|uniref:Uncharacterized protein n=1 Tax=Bacillus capparidis TaxID=1840411 RepID=A0ABS4CVM0_9BACI|nr:MULTISPECIES: hypothetical protein [Bacillus]MBP1081176.1 hypothetical protein [Bacillus capparidis]MED1095858.1 hypothetical protein [Bacillus capparidis]